ncbi:MAG: glycoside hydrolase family 5 protein [Oscillospiraceae bacterium]|jgi:endoglucanase|nr:glycoside hydrolase family 5 protein [Oscillospiraceae bacterium]
MKKQLKLICVLVFVLLAGMFTSCNPEIAPEENLEPDIISVESPDTAGEMRGISTMELVRDMGIGINLGNTLEATGDWIRGHMVMQYEMAWGSPIITEDIIKGYADAGFGVMRIPVAWSNLMDDDYTISEELLERVAEITDWVLANGMYAIINIHWDGGWWEGFANDAHDEVMQRYIRFWEQISEHFKDYSDMLLFESANEELGWHSLWNPWGGTEGKAESYAIVNNINQTFVDTVRVSGGNNAERHLLIAGYHTNIDWTCDPMFVMPDDPANRSAIKVHYYDPFSFTHLEQDESWARARWERGTDADFNELNRELDKMVINFYDKGIPVVIGEYGMAKEVSEEEMRNYTLAVTEAMVIRGFAPILWCVQRNAGRGEMLFYFDRHAIKMVDPEIEAGFKEIAQMSRN